MYNAGIPMDQQHSKGVRRSHTWPDNMTPMELLEGLADTSRSNCYDSMSTDLCHPRDEQEEGYTTDPDSAWKHPLSTSSYLPHPLSRQPTQREQGYVFRKPTDSHNEMGVELVEWYTNEGARHGGLASFNDALWLPPIQSNTPQALCLCANHQCHHSTTAHYQTSKDSYPFSAYSQSNSFMDLLNRSMARVTAMPLLLGNEGKVHMQAGTRVFSRLSYRATQSMQKAPIARDIARDMMVVGHHV